VCDVAESQESQESPESQESQESPEFSAGFWAQLAGLLDRTAAEVGPAVVGLGSGWGSGSGVVIGDGQVVTNAHNLRGPRLGVVFADGRRADAEVVAADADGDLAVLRVPTAGVRPVEWAVQEPAVGQPLVAVANPGGRGVRVSFGTVAAVGQPFRGPRGRRVTGGVEHTAPLPRGASGGPVVDVTGRLVGLNTHRLGEGFYLAVPATAELRARLDRLARGEAPTRRRLGVGLAPGRAARELRRAVGLPERDGLLVRAVEEDSPAGRAGIRTGDLLVAVAGQPLATVDDLFDALEATGDRPTVDVTVVRGAEEQTVTVEFGEPPATG